MSWLPTALEVAVTVMTWFRGTGGCVLVFEEEVPPPPQLTSSAIDNETAALAKTRRRRRHRASSASAPLHSRNDAGGAAGRHGRVRPPARAGVVTDTVKVTGVVPTCTLVGLTEHPYPTGTCVHRKDT